MNPIVIHENCYAIVDKNSQAILPNIIYCMAVSINLKDGRKIVAHLADVPGYPENSRKVGGLTHPIPRNYHATKKKRALVFEFLLKQAKSNYCDVKNILFYGNYLKRGDLFAKSFFTSVTIKDIYQFFKDKINKNSITIKYCSKVNILLTAKGRFELLPDEHEQKLILHESFIHFNAKLKQKKVDISFHPYKKGSKDDHHLPAKLTKKSEKYIQSTTYSNFL